MNGPFSAATMTRSGAAMRQFPDLSSWEKLAANQTDQAPDDLDIGLLLAAPIFARRTVFVQPFPFF